MPKCIEPINQSMIIRIILSVLSLYFLFYNPTQFFENNKYIILPILLTILDETDNIGTYFLKYRGQNNGCTKTWDYQIKDKYIDVGTYFLTSYLFNLDPNIFYLSTYRFIGIILFGIFKTSQWLVVFFDFVKEYMAYIYFFKNNLSYLPLTVLIKICFEVYFHSEINKETYE